MVDLVPLAKTVLRVAEIVADDLPGAEAVAAQADGAARVAADAVLAAVVVAAEDGSRKVYFRTRGCAFARPFFVRARAC